MLIISKQSLPAIVIILRIADYDFTRIECCHISIPQIL